MNRIASAFCIAFLIALLPCALFAQWKELPGPSAGAVNDICAIAGTNGAEMYAATPDGVYRTTDSARTWKLVGLRGQDVRNIEQYEAGGTEVLLAIVNEEASPVWDVCRSEDSAKTWDTIFIERPVGYQNDGGILNVVQDGNDIVICIPSLYGKDTATGIYRSTDIGVHWTHQAPVPTPGGNLPDFTIANGAIFAISEDTLWTMPTHSSRWVMMNYPSWNRPRSIKFVGNDLFVGAVGRLDISTDNGTTWLMPPNTGLDTVYDDISTFAVNGLTIVASGSSGAYRSTDGANSWVHIGGKGGFPLSSQVNGVGLANTRFFAATEGGLLSSPDGSSWTYATHGIFGGAGELAYNGATLFARAVQGIFRSTDHGQTWINPIESQDLADREGYFLQSVRGHVFAFNPGLWRWDDSEWDALAQQKIISVAEDSSTIFAASDSDGILRSLDNGVTWTGANNGLPLDSAGVTSVIAENGVVFAFIGNGSVYVSINDGNSWDWRSTNRSLGVWPAVLASDKIYAANEQEGKISFSKDNGASWDSITMPPNFDMEIGGLWSFGNGVAFSRNDGVYIADEAPLLIFHDSLQGWVAAGFAGDDSQIYISERLGHIYTEPLTSLPLAVSSEPNRSGTIVFHIFPNPTTSSGTFSFTLPRREHVSLQLFDERGMNIASYFDGVAGPGETQVPFDAPRIAPGTYIAVLSTPEGSAMARMVVLPK